ncbi:g3173 [Coccomyxa viridis]|uniref:G3173 protein n=1 Tax=Coccomyxa viridis TaxID=1274662 RepID=A0ABP1FM56_9CHLO
MRIEIPDEVRNKARTAAEAGGDIFTDEQLDKLVRQHHLQDAALFHPTSPIVQVASLAGANFRLLSWMLTLLSGTNDWCDRCDWNVGSLFNWLCKGHATQEDHKRVHKLFRGLSRRILNTNWLEAILGAEEVLGYKNTSVKRAVLEQVNAHAQSGKCVRLMDEVPGASGITWRTLFNDGFCHVLFVGDEHHYPTLADFHPASVATSFGYRQLCPPTSDPAALWCTILPCPAFMSMVEQSMEVRTDLIAVQLPDQAHAW